MVVFNALVSEVDEMEVRHIVAANRKERLLGKRRSLATEEVLLQT